MKKKVDPLTIAEPRDINQPYDEVLNPPAPELIARSQKKLKRRTRIMPGIQHQGMFITQSEGD